MRTLLTTTTLAAMLALGGTAWAQTGQSGAQSGQPSATESGSGTAATGPSAGGSANPDAQGRGAGEGSTRSAQPSGGIGGMTEEQVRARLTAEGFTNVQGITRSGNSFQARAMQNGRPVDITIDATTGTIRGQAAAR